MKNICYLIIITFFLLISCNRNEVKYTPDPNNGGLKLPKGFGAMIVADSVGSGRHIVVDDDGVIYVSLDRKKNGGGIAVLIDNNGDGRADKISYVGDCQGTGIAIYHHYLYFATDTSVIRFRLGPDYLPEPGFETVIDGYSLEHEHAAKTFAFDSAGNIYVNVGAPSNSCTQPDRGMEAPGMDPCPILENYGGIWQYSADKLHQRHRSDGIHFATGIRNAVAICWNAYAHHLYAVMHGRDQLYPQYKKYFSEKDNANLPGEEFLLINRGDNFGWPYCFFDPFQNKKVLSPEYGGDGKITGRSDSMKYPIMAFPAHWAPNDLLFYEHDQFPEKYRHGAFIAFHGSWNRAPEMQQGYNVAFVPFADSLPSGKWQIFADNFAGTDSIRWPGDARYRPCGLATGPDGSLYVVDSNIGRVWRIFYEGKS